jgi:type I restriction enzyme, S subunit
MKASPGALTSWIQRVECPAGWRDVSLGALADVIGGATPDRSEPAYWSGGTIPWATPTDITKCDGKWLHTTAEMITPRGLKECSTTLLPAGSILFTSRATIGAKAIAAIPMATNQGFASFIARSEVHGDFLYYLLDVLTPIFVRLGAGTTFLEISKRDVRKVRCFLPPPDEQASIARILDAVDTAIANIGVAIDKAQQLRRGVLNQFFERGLGRIAAADRPGNFIAPGWRLERTESLLAEEPKNGVSPVASSQPPGTPTFSIAAVRHGRIDLSSKIHLKYARIRDEVANEFAVRKGDVLVVRGNANPELVGKCGVIDEFPERCIYPDILKRVVFRNASDGVMPEYAVLAWNHFLVHNQVLKRAKTSNGTLKINTRDVKQIIMPVPPPDEQVALVKRVAAAEAIERALTQQLSATERLKRGLLHELLTGRLRIVGNTVPVTPKRLAMTASAGGAG